MIGRSVDHVPSYFLHLVRKRRPCDECGRATLFDDIEMWVATVFDRGHFIIRACRHCRGKRARLKWREQGSLKRLELRVAKKGFGSGAELVLTRRRLGLEPSQSVRGKGTP